MNKPLALRSPARILRAPRPRPAGPARARAELRRIRLEILLRLRDLTPSVRRSIDIIAALVGMILLSPLLAVVALGIKLTSRGPVLFRQPRIGKNGRPFVMLKLRTMAADADARKAALTSDPGEGVRFKMRRDPRVTALGRVLRRYSVDELPQLWNVLMGDMTIIGPRPPLAAEVARYDAFALRRLEVTQGLTCLWQVSGRSDLPFEEQVRLDVEYIDRTTARDELRILGRTIPAVLTGKGAY
ncbi:MAG: sugar transferase [Byssovorax sp.]